jgi:cytochrome c peroxidase
MPFSRILAGLSFLVIFNSACRDASLKIPEGWPEPIIADDKSLTEDRIRLGKRLFYDPVLSADSSVSCASCHNPTRAFADSVPVSAGVHGSLKGFRNTPSLFNVAWYPYFFSEGGAPDLELLAVAPMQTESEMDFNIGEAVRRLERNPHYVRLFHKAYHRAPDTYSLTRALGAFQRSLISGNSRYDQFIRGDSALLSPMEKRGMKLFFSERTGCSDCHSGFLLTDFGFYNLGHYSDSDPGRFRLTSAEEDRGKFKTPTLRNIALTAPYLHDGSIPDLEAMLLFYQNGGGRGQGKDSRIRPLFLSGGELEDILAFLKTLTDSSALSNPDYLPLRYDEWNK